MKFTYSLIHWGVVTVRRFSEVQDGLSSWSPSRRNVAQDEEKSSLHLTWSTPGQTAVICSERSFCSACQPKGNSGFPRGFERVNQQQKVQAGAWTSLLPRQGNSRSRSTAGTGTEKAEQWRLWWPHRKAELGELAHAPPLCSCWHETPETQAVAGLWESATATQQESIL